jgi:hypothetical protein
MHITRIVQLIFTESPTNGKKHYHELGFKPHPMFSVVVNLQYQALKMCSTRRCNVFQNRH